MRIVFLPAVLLLFASGLPAQSFQVQPRSNLRQGPPASQRVNLQQDWVARYDHGIAGQDGFAATAIDHQGNVYAVGNSLGQFGFSFSYEVLTTKYDGLGNLLWERRYDSPGSGFNDTAVDLAVDTDDSVVVLGTGPTLSGDQDVLLFRYDASGNLLWQQIWSNNWSDGAFQVAIAGDHSIYVLAQSYYGLPGASNIVLLKYDANGVLQWERNYDGHGGTDNPKMLAIDSNGDVYIAGETIMTFGTVNFDWLGLKYDSMGNLLWVFERGGAVNYPDYVNDMALHPSGGMVMTGYTVNRTVGGGGVTDITTMYIDSSGNLVWEAIYPNAQGRTQAVAVDAQGNSYVTGEPSLIVSYDPQGAQRWEQSFLHPTSLNGTGQGLAIDANGFLVASGRSFNQSSNTDFLLMLLDSATGNVFGSSIYNFGSYDDVATGGGSPSLAIAPGGVIYQAGGSSNGHDGDGLLRRLTY